MTDEVTATVPARKPRDLGKILAIVPSADGKMEPAKVQPPADARDAQALVKWLKGAFPEGGKFLLVREIAKVELKAVPTTKLEVNIG